MARFTAAYAQLPFRVLFLMEALVVFLKYRLPSIPCPERTHKLAYPHLPFLDLEPRTLNLPSVPN